MNRHGSGGAIGAFAPPTVHETAMSPSEIGSLVSGLLGKLDLSWTALVAYAGAVLGISLRVAGAFVRTMIPLRWLAVGSNVGLLVFGAMYPSYTTLAVAAVLLPIDLYRVREITLLSRKVSAAEAAGDLSGVWLRPYMKSRKYRAGQVLFHRGDRADRLYLLVEGRLELADIGREIEPGRIFGEIALFSPSNQRTHTVRCVTDCSVLDIEKSTVKQLYHEDPAFGFHLITLVAARLSEDVERVQAQHAAAVNRPNPAPTPDA
jgi:CRP/FNR family transcriptional regulator, cyclic AMP receptor protein